MDSVILDFVGKKRYVKKIEGHTEKGVFRFLNTPLYDFAGMHPSKMADSKD